MKQILTSLLLLLAIAGKAQVAVVLEDVTDIDYESPTSCTTHHRHSVTINSERGNVYADFGVGCDKTSSLTSFSGMISYKQGGTTKIKKSDLEKSEYSDQMATDAYSYHYSPSPASYPYTITYEWTERQTDAIMCFDVFQPQEGFDEQILSATYSITYPADATIYHAVFNMADNVKEEVLEKGKKKLSLSVTNLPAIKKEKFMPSASKIFQHAYFVPSEFRFGKTSGTQDTWQNYGKWMRSLQEGRDVLPDALKQKLHQLTDNVQDPYTKLLKVYRMLEESTRYVSIQLGIGGLQPAPVADVYTRGFGDCKGLSFYLISMLKEIGIAADYVEIGNLVDLPTSFGNTSFFNHVIVRVNMPDGSHVWVESTNPELPLGYVHQDIANHEALLNTAEGGVKVRLPKYTAKENTDSIGVKVGIAADGSATLAAWETVRNSCFEDNIGLLKLDANKQRSAIRANLSMSNIDFTSHSISQQMRQDRIKDERLPVIDIKYEGTCRKYANVTGSRIFVVLSPYDATPAFTPTATRSLPVRLASEDEITIRHIEMTIPEGYDVEFLPAAVNETNDFGSFKSSVTSADNKIIVDFRLAVKAGTFPVEKYKPLCAYLNKLHDFTSSKIVLKKRQ